MKRIEIDGHPSIHCAVVGCQTNGLAYYRHGKLWFCRKHSRALEHMGIVESHEQSNESVNEVVADRIMDYINDR